MLRKVVDCQIVFNLCSIWTRSSFRNVPLPIPHKECGGTHGRAYCPYQRASGRLRLFEIIARVQIEQWACDWRAVRVGEWEFNHGNIKLAIAASSADSELRHIQNGEKQKQRWRWGGFGLLEVEFKLVFDFVGQWGWEWEEKKGGDEENWLYPSVEQFQWEFYAWTKLQVVFLYSSSNTTF